MSYPSKRVQLKEVNPHIMCVLCGGYLIQATTVIECLHSFCKSCILNFLETSDVCPICDVKVHKTWPLMNIRLDQTLQSLVYKMVPGLFQDEMKKRREYHWTVSDSYVKSLNLEERGDAVMEKGLTTGPDQISLVLQMVSREDESSSLQIVDQRYLLCPAEFTIALLKKFVRVKFDLTTDNKIVMYKAKEELTDDLMLQDVAYIYQWKRDKPLHLFYSVGKNPLLRKRWPCTSAGRKTSALTSVSTAIGTFLAREDSPPSINSTAETKTVPKLTSLTPSKETTTATSHKTDTKTNSKRIKSTEPFRQPISQSLAMTKTSLASVTSPTSTSPNTFPITASSVVSTTMATPTTMPSKCTMTSLSSTTSPPVLSAISQKKNGPSSSLSSSLASSSSSLLTPTPNSSFPSLSSNNAMLQTNMLSSSSPSSISMSAKRIGATTSEKSLHPGSKKSSVVTNEHVKSGKVTSNPTSQISSKNNKETVKNVQTSGQSSTQSSTKKSIATHDHARNKTSIPPSIPVSSSPKSCPASPVVSISYSNPLSSHKTTVTTTTITTKSSYTNIHSSSNHIKNNDINIAHTTPIPKVAITTASTTAPKNNVQNKTSSAAPHKAPVLSTDSKAGRIKTQPSPCLPETSVKEQLKQSAALTPTSSFDQCSRGRKPKQIGSLPPTVKSEPSSSLGSQSSPEKGGQNAKEENKTIPFGHSNKPLCVDSKNQQKRNSQRNTGNFVVDISKQKSNAVNVTSSVSECSNQVSYTKSSVPVPMTSPSSLSSSPLAPSSPLLSKAPSNSRRIIHSVESILSPSPKQEPIKTGNRTDLTDKTSSGSKEKSLRLDNKVKNEVTPQYVTSVWKEAFGNTIVNKSDNKVDICDNKLLNKQRVQSNDSSKLPAQSTSRPQKSFNGNSNSLKRPKKDVETVSVALKNHKSMTDIVKCSTSEDNKIVPSSSLSSVNHQSKVPKETQVNNRKNVDSLKIAPVPLPNVSKSQHTPPVLLHKSMSCDESQSWSQQHNSSAVSPLEKRNWKKRKLSEIDQELSSSSSSSSHLTPSAHSHLQPQTGVKRRCLTPEVVTKVITDKFGRFCETVDDKEPRTKTNGSGKDSNDAAFSSFHHSPLSSPSSSSSSSSVLLSPLHSPPFNQGIDYHRHLHLQNYLHYHHLLSNKGQVSPTSMVTASSLRTSTGAVITSNQSSINSSTNINNNSNVAKLENNKCSNSFQSPTSKTPGYPSPTSSSRTTPKELPRFYSKATTAMDKNGNESAPYSDRNNNTNVISHGSDDFNKQEHKKDKIKQAIPNKPLEQLSASASTAMSSSGKNSAIYSTSSGFLDSHQRDYSNKLKSASIQDYRIARGQQQQQPQHLQQHHPQHHHPTLPSPSNNTNPLDNAKKLFHYTKKNEQDVVHNISIDVNSGINNNNIITNNNNNNNNNILVSVPSESSMSSPSQTSPSNSTCTMMTSPRSSLTSPGTDATSPGTEDRPDNAVLPVECRTACDEGGTTPPYAMATILTASVSQKSSTPLDLTNKSRKIQ